MNTSVNINLDTKGFSEKRLERIKNEISTEGFTDGTPNESFEGPSLYFSMEALKSCRKDFFGERHIEMVYATLVAWGMHRTGKGGAKMPEYTIFKESLFRNKAQIEALKDKRIEQLSNNDFKAILIKLKDLCFGENGIIGSTTKSRIVSSSKMLAHILPDLVPPIDRQYTATFFGYDKYNLSIGNEKKLFEDTMSTLYALYQDGEIVKSAHNYIISNPSVSLPKLFDNIIIALSK